MKIDIITKTRNTKFKFRILYILIFTILIVFLFNKLGVATIEIFRWTLLICSLIVIPLGWYKNYKINGYISLGENSIKVYENDELINKIDCDKNIINSINILWGTRSGDFNLVINGFYYLDSFNDSIIFNTGEEVYSYDIIIDRVGNERKSINWIFKKLEDKGIETGFFTK